MDAPALGATLQKTPLHALHLELGARMVPFAGYDMPVQYPAGILKEHLHTRDKAGLFDVSHMGQLRITGAGAARALEALIPIDIQDLTPGKQRYGFFTNEAGGILDDLMLAHAGDHLFMVVNAACKAADVAHLRAHLGNDVALTELADRALLALQGPSAGVVMARLAPESAGMVFMTYRPMRVDGIACTVTRSGYTGEDGFEISVAASDAERLARVLLAQPEVAPIGLGARDSLRLEAGLCLYGHDIDTTTTPVSAGLTWAIQKTRRTGGARVGGFPGAARILSELAAGAARKRVGIAPQTRAPVREGAALVDAGGRDVGRVTSGGFGPSVNAPVAMGYVDAAHAPPGTPLSAIVRDRPVPCKVAALPFSPHRYFRG